MKSRFRVATVVHKHGERTSVHAWAQLYHQTSSVGRIIWLILLLTGFLASALHIVKTIHKYRATPVSSQTYASAVLTEFPDVTVCPATIMPEMFVRNPHESRVVKKFLKIYDIQENQVEKFVNVILSSQDLTGLNLPKDIFIFRYSNPLTLKDESKFLESRLGYYGNCYTYSPKQRSPLMQGKIYGLKIWLYIGGKSIKYASTSSDTIRSQQRQKFEEFVNNKGDFAKDAVDVILHQPGTYPNINEAVSISGGTHVEIRFAMERHKLHNHKARPCRQLHGKKSKVKVLANVIGSGKNFTAQWRNYYTDKWLCKTTKFQRKLHKKCGCYK